MTISGILLLAAVFILWPQQEVVIKISEGMPAILFAAPKFIVRTSSSQATAAAEEVHQTLSDDLKFSRIFELLPKSYYAYIRPLDPGKILFKDWDSIQAKLLFVGEVSEAGKDLVFEGKLYDVKSERFIIGKRYQSERNVMRLAAHKMADEIMKVYGEKPIFTSKIAFVSDRDGNDELYMMDYDGQNQTRLTFNKVIDYMPAWSPDGKRIAFTSYRRGNPDLYILNLYEGKIDIAVSRGTSFAPSFSPDGKRIVFCSTQDGNAEIYSAAVEGTKIANVKRLTFNEAIDTAPSWSPNGREIVFTSDRGGSGSPQIYIMDAEGSNVRRVSFGGTYHDSPVWSPAGDRIAYISRVDQIFDIYLLNLRTNQIMKLTESNARNESPSWSPDGRHLVFSSTLTGKTQVYTVDYDGANLHRLTATGINKLPAWSK
jgi:TolB protein